MFSAIYHACFGGIVMLSKWKWNDYTLRLFNPEKNIRYLVEWIPYFWDNEVAFDLYVQIPKYKRHIEEDWAYHWELRDLDDQIVKQGIQTKQGDGEFRVSNQGIRRKLATWNSGKTRAIVLGNLHPNRQYRIFLKVTSPSEESREMQMASFTIKDRDELYMQLLILVFALGFSFLLWMLGERK